MPICPICNTEVQENQNYCPTCAWEFEYYLDELSNEEKRIYEDRLRIYQRIYKKSLLEPKVIEKIVYRDKVYTESTITTIDGLMYQNQPFIETYTWKEAKEYAKNLRLGGYDDWRLPTKAELKNLMTSTKNTGKNGKYYIRQEFVDNLHDYAWFWTSEEIDSSYAIDVYFYNGFDGWNIKTLKNFVMCVRG